MISSCRQIDEGVLEISVLIDWITGLTAEVESTLRTEDIAELELPRQSYGTAYLKGVRNRKIGRSSIKARPIPEDPCFRNVVTVASGEGSISIRLPRHRISDKCRRPNEAVGWMADSG